MAYQSTRETPWGTMEGSSLGKQQGHAVLEVPGHSGGPGPSGVQPGSPLEGRAVAGAQEGEEPLQGVVAESPGEDPELRLILVGKTGGGKSATGNTILGRREFESILGATTTTLRCQRGQGSWRGMKISVVDTPAIFDSDDFNEMVRREIMACIELSRPGPHALIFVTQVGRFTAEDAAAAKRVQDIFGAESARHTIVLFTCKEDLGGDPLQKYLRESNNRALRALIRQCGQRVCGFNNKAGGAEREGQVSELMGMVQGIVSGEGGRYYVSQLYLEPILQDAQVRSFLAKKIRNRAALGPWRSKSSWIFFILSLGFMAVIVIVIVLIVHLS